MVKWWWFSWLVGLSGCELLEADPAEQLEWSTTQSGGFDDFGSEGAALGYAVDGSGRILVIGLRFTLPVYQQRFRPDADGVAAARQWAAGAIVPPMADDVTAMPALAGLITDTQGLRGMHTDITAFLFDPADERLWIAVGGAVQLTREDGPYDRVEGALTLRPIRATGEAAGFDDGPRLAVDGIDFRWDTGEQWDRGE
jgi:hypothetical protein